MKTLAGICKHHGAPVSCKDPLMPNDIQLLIDMYHNSTLYDDLLFLALVTLSFNQLLCLGELCMPNNPELWDYWKSMMHFDLKSMGNHLELLLPIHKADKFFKGSTLVVPDSHDPLSPHPWLLKYLNCCDQLYNWKPELWLRTDSSSPSHSWFSSHLCQHFGTNISGHSMCAGGATVLAAASVSDDCICAMGRWSSDAYQAYIHQHSVILISQLHPSILSS